MQKIVFFVRHRRLQDVQAKFSAQWSHSTEGAGTGRFARPGLHRPHSKEQVQFSVIWILALYFVPPSLPWGGWREGGWRSTLCTAEWVREQAASKENSMYSSFSFSHRWNTEKQLWQYSLLDKVYFLGNFQNSHTRVVYWGNTGKYTPSRAGSILVFQVLAQLYWEYIFQYWPSSQLWRDSFENSPQGGLLMSPLDFQSARSFKTWPRIFSSAMGYKGIVYLEY